MTTITQIDRLLAEALAQATQIGEPFEKGLRMADLASKYALTNRRQEARRALAQALILARKTTDKEEQIEMLLEIADHFFRYERGGSGRHLLAKALTAARGIEFHLFQADALIKVAEKYGVVGDHERCLEILSQALTTAKKITDPDATLTILARIAGSYARFARPIHAAAIFAEAFSIAESMSHYPVAEQVSAICCIAEQYARNDACAAALAIFKTAPRQKGSAALHETQRITSARQYCLRIIAEQYAAADCLTDALAVAATIPAGYHKILALCRITGQYIAGDQMQQAVRLLDDTLTVVRLTPEGEYFRARSLAALAGQYLAAEKPARGLPLLAEAMTIAQGKIGPAYGESLQNCALQEIAALYAEAGCLPQAQKAAAAVTGPADKARVLAAVALGCHRYHEKTRKP